MEKTAILIIPTPEGQKYNYARKWKIPCVSPDWVFDSIEKGFCQSTTPFRIDQQQQKVGDRSLIDYWHPGRFFGCRAKFELF